MQTQPIVRCFRGIDLLHLIQVPGWGQISFCCIGHPKGIPVLVMHDLLGSRHLPIQWLLLANQLRLKLIIVERPGIGLSDNPYAFSHHHWLQFWLNKVTGIKKRMLQLKAMSGLDGQSTEIGHQNMQLVWCNAVSEGLSQLGLLPKTVIGLGFGGLYSILWAFNSQYKLNRLHFVLPSSWYYGLLSQSRETLTLRRLLSFAPKMTRFGVKTKNQEAHFGVCRSECYNAKLFSSRFRLEKQRVKQLLALTDDQIKKAMIENFNGSEPGFQSYIWGGLGLSQSHDSRLSERIKSCVSPVLKPVSEKKMLDYPIPIQRFDRLERPESILYHIGLNLTQSTDSLT